MIEAYEQKQKDLKAVKKGKGSRGSKKRRRRDDNQASDNEVRLHLNVCIPLEPIHSGVDPHDPYL